MSPGQFKSESWIEYKRNAFRAGGQRLNVEPGLVDAAVYVFLADIYRFFNPPPWREVQLGGNLVVYQLIYPYQDHDPLGELWLRRIHEQAVSLYLTDPPIPTYSEALLYLARTSLPNKPLFSDPEQAQRHLEEHIEARWLKKYEQKTLTSAQRSDIRMLISDLARGAVDKMDIEHRSAQSGMYKSLLFHLDRDGLLRCDDDEPGSSETPPPPAFSLRPAPPPAAARPGHPGLPPEEVILRLAYALWAIELRQQDPQNVWKNIARQVEWPYDIKLLEDARRRLERAEQADDLPLLMEARHKLVELKTRQSLSPRPRR